MPTALLRRLQFAMPVLSVVWLTACLETAFTPVPGAFDDVVEDAKLDAGDVKKDSKDSSVADASDTQSSDALVDTLPDAPADAPVVDVVLADVPVDAADSAVLDTVDVPPDSGIAGLPLGATCITDKACESGLCVDDAVAHRVCSLTCTGECPAGFRCSVSGFGDLSGTFCMPLPSQLCVPCNSDDECKDGACIPLAISKESLCGLDCSGKAGAGTTCPVGFLCQSANKGSGAYCVPELQTCSCTEAIVGESWSCEVGGVEGSCPGVQFCQTSGWSTCSAQVPGAELCDGKDNDCNGKIDDGVTNLYEPCGTGYCAGGTWMCAKSGKGKICSTDAFAAPKETCFNSVDDDCNGITDDGCSPNGLDSDGDSYLDINDCDPFDSAIHLKALEPCCKQLPPIESKSEAVPVTPATKGCDWNCDGTVLGCFKTDVDQDGSMPPLDCDDGNPAIFGKGSDYGQDKCGDGVDQDCDGSDAVCNALNDQDGDGYPVPADCDDDAPLVHPGAAEICDYKDNDCDALVDEGNPGGGASCGTDKGICSTGTMVCFHDGTLVSMQCGGEVAPMPEICDGLDNNCDGKTDELFEDLGKGCDGPDIDQCKTGVVICGIDHLSTVCGPEANTDLADLCAGPGKGDGIDQNCNGQTDESCFGQDPDGDGADNAVDCNPSDSAFFPKAKEGCCNPALSPKDALAQCDKNCDGKTTPCLPSDTDLDGYAGNDDCDDADASVHPGAPEKCGDGVDQDCADGDQSCAIIASQDDDGDGYANKVDCKPSNADIHPGAPETCNGKDDNCDGLIDEGNPGAKPGACGSHEGLCQPGVETCVHVGLLSFLSCAPKVGPSPDVCNGLDDNCNGLTDEFFPLLGKACDSGDSDQCKSGTWTCSADGKSAVCNNESVTNLFELCNGVDDNCDGKTDEGINYFGKKVGEGCKGIGLCGIGKVECSPELQVALCSTDAYGSFDQSEPETCNGIDDDCDGQTDEGVLYGKLPIGAKCVGAGYCAGAVGTVECDAVTGTPTCSSGQGGTAYAGKPEECNGVDDDCDGHVDEGLSQEANNCKKLGVCAGAGTVVATCAGGEWQCDYQGVAAYEGKSELSCDGLDNNCDGDTDEPFQLGVSCDGADSDKCTFGVTVCTPDKTASECGVEAPSDITEACNGLDDDCDGLTDEDFPVAEACDSTDTDLCATGTWTCRADGQGAECTNEKFLDILEICDAADDDCDGLTDEGFAVGEACDGTDTDQCSMGTYLCTPDGTDVWCINETVQNYLELCDGKDNNCDGVTDEDFAYTDTKTSAVEPLGTPCNGIGGCGVGVVICSPIDLVATCSTNPNADPDFNGTELCDGLDNNCDGQTDEGLTYNGIPLKGTCPAVGECEAGVVQCGNQKKATCSTAQDGANPQGKAEGCDGKDNDCNGKIDDGMTAANSDCAHVGVCAGPELVATCGAQGWKCDYSQVPAFQINETLCDGLDNDCDGQTDEGYNIGQACDGDDSDQCKTGTWTCDSTQSGAQCINESLTNIVETCDGADNDCDGAVDEGFTYQGKKVNDSCKGIGACGVGSVVCGTNLTATCSTNPDAPGSQAQPEICDNKDNNCDGETDEGISYKGLTVGALCTAPGTCGDGVVECKMDHTVTCSSAPDGTNSQAGLEDCNGLDDDCDGTTDNNLATDLAPCNQAGVCADALKATCDSAKKKWGCTYSGSGYEAPEKLCDGKDNDCNGITDDGYNDLGSSCDGIDPDQCPTGKRVCGSDQKSVVCDESPTGTTKVESCNGVDDDCNGQTDETWPTLGQTCDGNDSDACKNGVIACHANATSTYCFESTAGTVEICNALDDDCNGLTDDGLSLGVTCDGDDADFCKNGVLQCATDGSFAVVCAETLYTPEVCDGIDNDCDSQTDEGFNVGFKCKPSGSGCSTGTIACNAQKAAQCMGGAVCTTPNCNTNTSPTTPETCK